MNLFAFTRTQGSFSLSLRLVVLWLLGISLVQAAELPPGLEAAGNRVDSSVKTQIDKHLVLLTEDAKLPSSFRQKAKVIRLALGNAESPEGPSPTLASSKPNLVAGQISDITKQISQEEPTLSAYLLDLALKLNPDDVDIAYALEVHRIRDSVAIEWGDLPDPPRVGQPPASVSSPKGPMGKLGRSQALIKGLLVQQLAGSLFAGSASQMNATAMRSSKPGQESVVRFNQRIGDMMEDGLATAVKLVEKEHGDLPKGLLIELSFEEQYIPKDGPSAGVACYLLLKSLLSDIEYDPGFAVTGAISPEGIVGSVGGIDGKIRGAVKRDCMIIAIPVKNSNVVSDLLILEGPRSLAQIQIFSIKTQQEALALAKAPSERSDEIQQAIAEFEKVQQAILPSSGSGALRNPKVLQSLRKVLELAPNHLSARYLAFAGMGKTPRELSLSGSLTAIDRAAAPLLKGLEQGRFEETDAFSKNFYLESMYALQRQRSQLDPRTRDCADEIITFSKYVNNWVNDRPKTRKKQIELINQIESAGSRVGKQFEGLYGRTDVKREIGVE